MDLLVLLCGSGAHSTVLNQTVPVLFEERWDFCQLAKLCSMFGLMATCFDLKCRPFVTLLGRMLQPVTERCSQNSIYMMPVFEKFDSFKSEISRERIQYLSVCAGGIY